MAEAEIGDLGANAEFAETCFIHWLIACVGKVVAGAKHAKDLLESGLEVVGFCRIEIKAACFCSEACHHRAAVFIVRGPSFVLAQFGVADREDRAIVNISESQGCGVGVSGSMALGRSTARNVGRLR